MKASFCIFNETIATFIPAAPNFVLDAAFKDTLILKAGSSSTVHLPFLAYPLPKSSVSFNGGVVRDVKRISCTVEKTKATLSIKKVEKLDAGDYVIVLENEFGKTTVTIKVVVLGK